jgi:PAS domain S-box-containing protein
VVQINYRDREITAKIVYYGPALSGKTTNLQVIHECMNFSNPTQFFSLNTKNDRTLFFDLLPINLGQINDFNIKIQVYTVPGQVQYNSTRKVVLAGCDAIIFVADSQKSEAEANLFSITNMKSNLRANGLLLEQIPWILQYNKRDLPGIMSIDEMNQTFNKSKEIKAIPATAPTGEGVFETFIEITQMMLESIMTKYRMIRTDRELNEVAKAVTSTLKNIIDKYKEGQAAAAAAPPLPVERTTPAAQPEAGYPLDTAETEPVGDAAEAALRAGIPEVEVASSGAVHIGDEFEADEMESTQAFVEGKEAGQPSSIVKEMHPEVGEITFRTTQSYPSVPPESYTPPPVQDPALLAQQQRQVTTFQLGQAPSIDGHEAPGEQEFLSNEQLVETAVQANMKITELSNKLAESEAMFEAKLQEMQLLGDIAKALISELNFDHLLEMILRSVIERLGVKYASINLYDKEKKYIEPRQLHGLKEDPIISVLGDKLIKFLENIISKGKMAVITSAENKSLAGALNRYDNYTSFITVSLKFKNSLLGVLNVYYKDEDTYKKEDLRFIIMLASYASIAVVNATLYKEMNQATSLLQNIIKNSNDVIINVSPIGRILSWNGAAKEIFGYDDAEIIGKNMDYILESSYKKTFEEYLKLGFAGRIVKNQILYMLTKAGVSFRTLITVSPISGEDNKIMSCSAIISRMDGTPAAAVQSAGAQAQPASAHGSITEGFLLTLAAEVEPQITNIKKQMLVSERKLQDSIEADKTGSFRLVKASIEELEKIIDNALKLKKMKAITPPSDDKLEDINVNDLLMSIIYTRQQEIDVKKITLDIPGNLPVVRFPQSELTQIFNNILSESIKFAEKNPRPVINIGYKDEKSGFIFFAKSSPVGPQTIDVNTIFDTDNPAGKGKISLSLAKQIIDKFNGKIWIEAVPSVHITIFFSLPKF